MLSIATMIWLFVYTLNDSYDNLIVTNTEWIGLHEKNIFPGISVCISLNYYLSIYDDIPKNVREMSAITIKEFIQKYYAEHKIDEPKQ